MTPIEALKKLTAEVEKTEVSEKFDAEDLTIPLSSDDVTENSGKKWKVPDAKSRVWVMLLYPDCPEHQEIIDRVYNDFVCVGAFHDCDVNENGEQKKEHYHIVFYFQSAVYASHILNQYPKLDARFLRPRKDIKVQVRYLLHLDSPSKYQYSDASLEGHVERFSKFINSEVIESNQVIAILDLIETQDLRSLKELVRAVCVDGLYSTYRRNAYTFNAIFNEKMEGANLK